MKYSGSLVSIAGGLESAVWEAIENSSNCFMCFTRSPRGNTARALSNMSVPQGIALYRRYGLQPPVIHAPFIINLASPDEEIRINSIDMLTTEISRAVAFGAKYLVVHPGNYTTSYRPVGIKNSADSLSQVLDNFDFQDREFYLCLESMSGKGTEIGYLLEELREIRDRCRHKDKIAFCLDTCHLHAAGYALNNINDGNNDNNSTSPSPSLIDKVGRILGYENVKVCHVAGSKNARGAHADNHAGLLAPDNKLNPEHIKQFVNNPKLNHTLFVLETPNAPNHINELRYLRQHTTI